MAAKGGVGIELDLDRVPAREPGMSPYDFLLSESQERMLLVVQAGREPHLMGLFHRWGLNAEVVGPGCSRSPRCAFCRAVRWWLTYRRLPSPTTPPVIHRSLPDDVPRFRA